MSWQLSCNGMLNFVLNRIINILIRVKYIWFDLDYKLINA